MGIVGIRRGWGLWWVPECESKPGFDAELDLSAYTGNGNNFGWEEFCEALDKMIIGKAKQLFDDILSDVMKFLGLLKNGLLKGGDFVLNIFYKYTSDVLGLMKNIIHYIEQVGEDLEGIPNFSLGLSIGFDGHHYDGSFSLHILGRDAHIGVGITLPGIHHNLWRVSAGTSL